MELVRDFLKRRRRQTKKKKARMRDRDEESRRETAESHRWTKKVEI